jgi:hypothetical protein
MGRKPILMQKGLSLSEPHDTYGTEAQCRKAHLLPLGEYDPRQRQDRHRRHIEIGRQALRVPLPRRVPISPQSPFRSARHARLPRLCRKPGRTPPLQIPQDHFGSWVVRQVRPHRRITVWENEEVIEAVRSRLDRNPDAMRTRREMVTIVFRPWRLVPKSEFRRGDGNWESSVRSRTLGSDKQSER